MAEDGKFRVEKFNDQNFSLWKMQMEYYMYQKDLYLPLGRKTKMLTGMMDEEWNLLDRKALRTIRLCLASSVAFNISKETMIEGLIKALEKLYEEPLASNKLFSIGVNFDDEVRAMLFLCSLPEIWNGLVMVISNSISGSSTLKCDDVVGAILSEEMRRKSSVETSGNALSAESRGRKMERGKSLGYHNKSRKGRSKARSGIVCWKCGKKGHLKKDCRSQKGKKGDA
eukprot:PITA_29967